MIFWGGPILASFYFSFTEYAVIGTPQFIGLDNYVKAFTVDKLFWGSLGRTFTFAALYIPFAVGGAMILAIFLNQRLIGTTIYRTLFFVPSLVPAVALAVLWTFLLAPRVGPVNEFLRSIGISDPPGWLASRDSALASVTMFNVWAAMGGNTMLIFLAGLQATHASTVGVLTRSQEQAGNRFEVGAIALPPGSEGRQGTCFSGNHWMINSNSKAPAEAWEFAKLLTSKEAGIFNVLEANRQTNGRKSVWTDPEVNAVNPLYDFTDKAISEGVEPYPMPWNTRFAEANNLFQAEINLIWEGDETFAEYAGEIERKVQAVLDEPMPS